MSTRSQIGKLNKDGTVTAIYCHFDGYPSGVGKRLFQYYQDEKKLNQLMALGDISILGSEIGEKHTFDSDLDKHRNWCNVYGRDRGETGTKAKTYPAIETYVMSANQRGSEYLYLWGKKNGWQFLRMQEGASWTPLTKNACREIAAT